MITENQSDCLATTRHARVVPDAPAIPRDNFLVTIEDQLAGEATIVVVEGHDGIGKSTLLRQFAERHASENCSLFISSASRWAYDPSDILAEFCEQLESVLGTEHATEPDEFHLRRLLSAVSRRSRASGRTFFFIVDGICDIPSEDRATRDAVFSLLPFGVQGFRFVLSGSELALPFTAAARSQSKSLLISGFSVDETQRYLENCGLTSAQIVDLWSLTKGAPGHLATVRRLLEAGHAPLTVLERLDSSLPKLFDLEWGLVGDNASRLLILGILAYENRPYSIDRLAAVSQLAPAVIESELSALTFVTRHASGTIRFVSESFRTFVEDKLRSLRDRITELFIEYFLRDPESEEALTHLPSFFASAEKLSDLVAYLSPERFATLYRKSSSVKIVQQKADQGIAAARELNRPADVMRFSLQRSTIEELADSETTTFEVRALASLNDFDSALALAEATTRSEERFRLLVAIARARHERGDPNDPGLLTRIRALYTEIEPGTFGRRVADVAADLFHVIPELAIDLLNTHVGRAQGENSIDWALARLSIQAALNRQDDERKEHARDIRDRIADPGARRLSTEAIVIFGNMSAVDVIAESRRLDATGDRLYVLQQWMLANARRADAVDVLQEGLALAIGATAYSADARVFRELALCLPFLTTAQEIHFYLTRFDGQSASIERLGPTEEFIRLQLLLARAQWSVDHEAARGRYLEIYNAIASIKDMAVRAASTARLVSALTRTDPGRELESDALHSISEQELDDGVNTLLSETAEHVDALRGVIEALARTRPELALTVVGRMNTETRRDTGYALIVDEVSLAPVSSIDPTIATTAIKRIVDVDVRDEAVETWIVNSARRAKLDDGDVLGAMVPLVTSVQSVPQRVRVATAMLAGLHKTHANETMPELRTGLIDTVNQGWRALDTDWMKLEVGYGVVADLGVVEPVLAGDMVKQVNDLKAQLKPVYNLEASLAALLGVSLAIRAYAGMVEAELSTPIDADRVREAIQRVPSIADQAILWAQLALRHFAHGDRDACEKIVNDYLMSLLLLIEQDHPSVYASISIMTLPAVYCASPGSLEPRLRSLGRVVRDRAINSVVSFLLTKAVPGDPYQYQPRAGFNIEFATATAIVTLLGQIENDNIIYTRIVHIVDSAASPAYRDNFKQGQRGDLVRQLEELVQKKLPAPRFIYHDGYRIASDAYINQIREKKNRIDDAVLMNRARAIPNASDSCYVLAIVAATGRDDKKRRELLAEVSDAIERIPLLGERVDRYDTVSGLVSVTDQAISKKYLQRALTLSLQGTGESMDERRRSLVDHAYRIDQQFASSLASAIDDEPAKRKIESEVAIHRLKNALGAKRSSRAAVTPKGPVDAAQAAWMQLGELNARRATTVSIDRSFELMRFAASEPVGRSYAIFAWAIENAVRRTGVDKDVRGILVNLFEACLRGAELAAYAVSRPGAASMSLVRRPQLVPELSGQQILRDGERGEALHRIRDWLRDIRPTHLWIVDPYFTPVDVGILQLVQETLDDCAIDILTSKQAHKDVDAPYEDTYRSEWSRVSSQEPPDVSITLIGTQPSGRFPIHDRWWLSAKGGLYCGTSLSGLGKRWTEMRYDAPEKAMQTRAELASFFEQGRQEFEGEPVKYSTIKL